MNFDLFVITLCVFAGVTALILAVYQWVQAQTSSRAEKRLARWSGSSLLQKHVAQKNILAEALRTKDDFLEKVWTNFKGLRLLFEQADVTLSPSQLALVSGALGLGAIITAAFFRMPLALWPALAVTGLLLPWGWLLWRRNKRLKAFAAQMPEAMDMLARALRAGQSLAAGIGLVGKELPPPLGKEFARVFDEQNLGLSLEESLRELTERVPNMDLKFFVTAVVLQRQTGGDLAEILEKIATLVRQRFQIYGQIQALTAEGRLSGIVLMALPVFLFFAMYYLNREYVMLLFTDPMGNRMLMIAVLMQVLGAIAIRKIVSIRV
ncbi:MAG: type II secretion system F family protein [Thermoguttaceae bacterium]|nr:type II secretion system F family protein [Thermoguttaceae bacterium]MDW8078529.1 type II secretion system F family protein [Thermoguttaceae bacterium]